MRRDTSETWYSYCPEDGMTLHGSEEEARHAAESSLDGYRDDAMQGEWHPDMHMLSWGLLVPFQEARQVDVKSDENSEYDFTCDYVLGTVQTDAEDRVPHLSCWCQCEAGDSPCPVHGMDEEPEEKAAPKLDNPRPKFEVKPGIRLKSPYRDEWTVDGILEDTMVTLRNDEGITIDRPVHILHSWWSVV